MAPAQRFSKRTYAAPFGRFEAGNEAEPPADEVLIGRAGQRAYFIDILLRAGRRGAFLVTGNRGVGKSSFVRYCLREYEEEVFERFLRSNVGRTAFWDRILILLLFFLAPLAFLMVSELVEVLVQTATQAVAGETGGAFSAERILPWVVIAPLVVIVVYPLLFGWEVFLEVVRTRFSQRSATIRTILTTTCFLFAIWEFRPFGAPALSLSRLFCICCGLYLWVRCSSFHSPPDDGLARKIRPHALRTFWRSDQRWRLLLHYLVLGNPWPFALVSLPLLYWGVTPFASLLGSATSHQVSAEGSFSGNLAIGFMLLGAGMFLHGLHQRRSDDSERRAFRQSGAGVYQISGALVFLSSALFLGLQDRFTLWFSGATCAIAVVIYTLVQRFYRRWWRQPGQPGFRPRPRQALLLKAAIAFVIGSQLVFPVTKLVFAQVERTPFVQTVVDGPLKQLGALGDCLFLPAQCSPDSELTCAAALCDRLASADRAIGLFDKPSEELHWALAAFLLLLVLAFLDYDWVLRPYLAPRAEAAIASRASTTTEHGPEPGEDRTSLRSLARLTLPWPLYEAWLPILTVSVNLGFERLDHRRVVQAMLVGLRARFHRAFLSWNSGIANLGRLLLVALLLSLTTLAGNRWFSLPSRGIDYPWLLESADRGYSDLCGVVRGAQAPVGVPRLLCHFGWGDAALHLLYLNFLERSDGDVHRVNSQPRNGAAHATSTSAGPDHLLLGLLVPRVKEAWPPVIPPYRLATPFIGPGFGFRVYHLLLFVLLWVIARWLLRRVPIFPYAHIVRRIDGVLDSLTSSTSVTSRVGRWPPAQWLEGFLIGERVRQTQQEPFDPRAVEFLFLQILEEIQEAAIRLPGARNQRISLPVPEITFFFDELDKLGTRVDPQVEEAGEESQRAEILNAERKRSLELHKLLADMKNLLSAAAARFIFVGGRNLHDEWLADQTARQPLLTNIFTAEVYLPSLLTDRSRNRELSPFDDNVELFVAAQLRRARGLFERHQDRLFVPSFALRLEDVRQESFPRSDDADARPTATEPRLPALEIFATIDGRTIPGRDELVRDFLQFLTYRSMGNPKRLRELLMSFVRPVGRLIGDRGLREKEFCCDHLLVFDDIERFRIQLIARIFRHLNLAFQRGLLRRDDKVVVSAFYLSDFLFKFHRRAFSWGNLERVEDMAHIHRAPDLRRVLETLVERWSERFLHRIRNGMYDFRFRSEVAREIEHISRQSPPEMAEFNFALDESQALKTAYEAAIRRLDGADSRELQDLIAGLGELHEFDQEYETARLHYRHAIALLDADLRAITGGSELLEKSSPMMQILAGRSPGPEHAQLYLTWGIARLRLMLQVGMTYELARSHERASVEYANAGTLARALLLALLDQEGRQFFAAYQESAGIARAAEQASSDPRDDRLEVLKHLNLLFQPIFASAWVAEKLIGAVDTSVTLVESTLDEWRSMLPFVRNPRIELAGGPVEVRHSNFALIAAELHNKAGDLYFFKGRQVTSREAIAAFADERDLWRQRFREWQDFGSPAESRPQPQPRHGQEGYLLRAHHHYAVGLHELRRFIAYRKQSSGDKWNIKASAAYTSRAARETIETEGWPDYVYRSLGGTFNDFAEVMLGRVSIYGLLRGLGDQALEPKRAARTGDGPRRATEKLVRMCSRWLELTSVRHAKARPAGDPGVAREAEVVDYRIAIPLRDGSTIDCGTLGGWLGYWDETWQPEARQKALVTFDEWAEHDDLERLSVALNLMLVGAKYLERGGYVEDGAREFSKVAEIATSYLWWWKIVRHLVERIRPHDTKVYEILELDADACTRDVKEHPFWDYLGSVAQYSLEKADQLFRQGRQVPGDRAYLVGERIPVSCCGAACSLALVSMQLDLDASIRHRNLRMLRNWTAQQEPFIDAHRPVATILEEVVERHSYPMLGRLNGLNLRILDELLRALEGVQPDGDAALIADCDELFDLVEDLHSPLHFTPMQPGITLALVYLLRKRWVPQGEVALESLRRRAHQYLLRSEEMYTLKRAFYEGIADLYYLYDDFNDRQIHFHHALQMAGSELVTMLRYLVGSKDYENVVEDPLTVPVEA